ncbi:MULTISPECIES: hypothetical protein [unclassified Lysobacter]|nr:MULTISPECIES: hypothetical protein [unclassified Lysobacter]MBT2747531.1 hypothetical protein [Lysobacter sp. ISL-42]MBT2776227.1 hypothetical protein [Lysobacter sp. ISL-54]
MLKVLAAIGLFVCAAGPAAAQSYKVGSCNDQMGKLEIVESIQHFPGGQSNKVTQFVRPGLWGPQQVYDSIPDGSGIHLAQIKSGAAGVAFWLARNGNLVATNQYGWQIVGACQYQTAWAEQFPAPVFVPAPQPVPFALGADVLAEMPTITSVNGAQIPAGILQPGVLPGVPALMSLDEARECYERADGDQDELFLCGAEKAMGSKERAAAECVRSAPDNTAAGLCLLGNQLPDAQAKAAKDVADCYQKHGASWNDYPVCMAEKQADPQTARLINCARQQMQQGQQPDYWTMGYCAFGRALLNPNPESTIAIQCALATKGQPGPFVGCAGGRLLYRELDKCLNDGIGGDDGCFGKNNTLTKAYDRVEEELRKALGGNSVAFKAWQAARLSMDPHQMAEAARKVRNELNQAIANGNAAMKQAGKDAMEWVDAATPDITVSTSGIKIEGVKVGQIGKGLKCCKL